MNLENQVCSLDIAKRLKELGVKQESLFTWEEWPDGPHLFYADGDIRMHPNYAAYTVAEVGEILPETLGRPRDGIKQYDIEQYKYTTGDIYQLQVSDYVNTVPHLLFVARDKNEANARTKCLVYLLENKLIK